MPKAILGLHHVTAIASEPQRNLDFYTEVVGLRLVKRTVNFDDPGTYHFYFGDDTGTPGSILTFFPWPHARRGSLSSGETSATAFSVPVGSLEYWEQRLQGAHVPVERLGKRFGDEVLRFADPDGMSLEIVEDREAPQANPPRTSDVPAQYAIRGFFGVTLNQIELPRTAGVLEAMGFQKTAEEGNRHRFRAEGTALGRTVDVLIDSVQYGRMGAGTVHHIAFRVPDAEEQLAWRDSLAGIGIQTTPVQERTYFESIYFREPGGVLYELATDPPGFLLDESAEGLGETLKLPPWLEAQRPVIEQRLPPIELHAHSPANRVEEYAGN